MKNIIKVLIVILVAFSLSACYPELKLARSYIESKPEISIMVLPTNFVFKKNLKVNELGSTIGLSELQVDSALMQNSVILQHVSDSVFLETFINSLIVEFEKLGFIVYTENLLDSFLFLKTPAYIFNVAQIELEEHIKVHEDKQEFGDYMYYKKVDMNAINYNFWFELSELNDDKENTKLFYASETIHDQVYGYFTENIFTGYVKYKYNKNEIDLDILYRYSDVFGERYAGYTYDFLMNKYLDENLPDEQKRRYYMHYKRENNSLDPTWTEKFELMEE